MAQASMRTEAIAVVARARSVRDWADNRGPQGSRAVYRNGGLAGMSRKRPGHSKARLNSQCRGRRFESVHLHPESAGQPGFTPRLIRAPSDFVRDPCAMGRSIAVEARNLTAFGVASAEPRAFWHCRRQEPHRAPQQTSAGMLPRTNFRPGLASAVDNRAARRSSGRDHGPTGRIRRPPDREEVLTPSSATPSPRPQPPRRFDRLIRRDQPMP